MILGALLLGSIVGLFLVPFIAFGITVNNRKLLAEMDELIEQYDDLSPEDREANRAAFRKRMMEIKAGISAMDRQSTEAARDKIAII